MGQSRARVVVVGGGFGGLFAARELKGAPAEIVLIDRENHHLFQPLLYQVATAGLSPSEIAVPIRSVLADANTEVYLGEVCDVDLTQRQVKLRDGHVMDYEYLVVAAGAETNYFGNDDWNEHAYGMKDLRDALRLKERILLQFERAEHERNQEERDRMLTFVVVGGGPTGVELAGAVSELGRSVLCQDFRHIEPEDIRVVLVEMTDRVLSPFDPKLSESAKRQLEELSVEVRLEAKVEDIGPSHVTIGGESLACGLVCWAPGVKPVPLAKQLGVALEKGKVMVDSFCALPEHPEVFVIGDMAAFKPSTKEGEQTSPLPALAAVAMQQGKHVGKLIRKELLGQPRQPFEYSDRGIMATIGRARAVAQTDKLRLSGFVAWLAWIFVHVLLLIGFRNRVLVLYEWFWAYVFMKRGSRVLARLDQSTAAALVRDADAKENVSGAASEHDEVSQARHKSTLRSASYHQGRTGEG